jgi:osmotically-inducible protein OsmY
MNYSKIFYIASFLIVFCITSPSFADSRSIRNNIVSRLEQNKNLGRHEFEIDVRGAVVSFDGFVSSETDKRLVERVALETRGVAKVVNRLVVDGPGHEDLSGLAKQIRDAIKARSHIRGYKVDINQVNGEIVLEGYVSSVGDRLEIGSLAIRLAGAINVLNKLTVNGPNRIEDAVIRQNIEAALQAEQVTGVDAVTFEVKDGIVNFSGQVVNHRDIDRVYRFNGAGSEGC